MDGIIDNIEARPISVKEYVLYISIQVAYLAIGVLLFLKMRSLLDTFMIYCLILYFMRWLISFCQDSYFRYLYRIDFTDDCLLLSYKTLIKSRVVSYEKSSLLFLVWKDGFSIIKSPNKIKVLYNICIFKVGSNFRWIPCYRWPSGHYPQLHYLLMKHNVPVKYIGN